MAGRGFIIATTGFGIALVATTALAQSAAPQTPSGSVPSEMAPAQQQALPAQEAPSTQPQISPSLPERSFSPVRSSQEIIRARYLVHNMEGVLESAVKYAASQMNRRLQAVSPDLLQLSGAARAHGFRLDGYGVFFDVEVPAALRQTMGWTMRMMQNDPYVEQALTALRQVTSGLDGKQRGDADNALKLIELRVRPNANAKAYTPPASDQRATPVTSTIVAASTTAPDTAPPVATRGPSTGPSNNAGAQGDLALTENPDLTYEMEVRDALVGAMLEYGTSLSLGPDEWLTIAARDNQNVIVPGDLTETVTVILRIKGSDLADYRSGRINEGAARGRVEVREF